MQSFFRRSLLNAAGLATLLVATTPAFAETVSYGTELNGSNEVPPTDSKGIGTVDAIYDSASKKLTWTVTYSGLTGDAVAAHFHGPAAPGVNAPPVVPIKGKLTSPIK